MFSLVTFDLYDTLIELDPPRWVRLANACAAVGMTRDGQPVDVDLLRTTDLIAEDFYTRENTIQPIRDRTTEERNHFRREYLARWLDAAGIPHDPATIRALRKAYVAEFDTDEVGGRYGVFDDVLPALTRLRDAGLTTAIISNADADVTELCTRLAFAGAVDLIVTSALVGWEKPDPRTFQAALRPLGIDPAGALHIGDQPRSDVVGALEVGMRAALLDRYGRYPDPRLPPPHPPVPTVPDLMELTALVLGD